MSKKSALSRRQFLKGSAVAAAGGLLAACAPQAAATSAPAPTSAAAQEQPTQAPAATQPPAATEAPKPTTAPAKAEVAKLRYLSPDRELENKVNQMNIDAFNAAMKDQGKPYEMSLELGAATDNDYRTKMTVDAAAGTMADVSNVYAADIADYNAAGYLLDLKSYLESWDGWKNYYDVLKPFAYVDGKLLGLPGGTTFTFFVRKDVLDANKISSDQPKTWDDFYKACDAIKKAGVIPCGIPAATPWGGGTFQEGFRMVWLSFNDPIFDDQDKKWVVSSPGLLGALTVYETLAKNKWLDVKGLMTPNPWEPIKYQEFPKGQLAIVTGGDWQWTFDWGPAGATPIDGLFDKVTRWEFPTPDGKPFSFVEGSVSPCVFSKTKSPEGCVAYIEFTADPAMGCKTMDTYIGGPSARKDFADVCPAYKTIVGGKYFESGSLFDAGRTYNFSQIGNEKIADGIAKATEDVINLKKTPQQAMDAFAKEMETQIGADKIKKM
jgi:multiple sugar transport system substrate-binding protein